MTVQEVLHVSWHGGTRTESEMNQTEDRSMLRTITITTAHCPIHDTGVVSPQDIKSVLLNSLYVVMSFLIHKNCVAK